MMNDMANKETEISAKDIAAHRNYKIGSKEYLKRKKKFQTLKKKKVNNKKSGFFFFFWW